MNWQKEKNKNCLEAIRAMENNVEVSAGDFFTQKLKVGDVTQHSWEYCKDLCRGQKVLHIGCSDYPIFEESTNLHIKLVYVASELHGCDLNGLDVMRKHYDGIYIKHLDASDADYDIILVPNIIEHLVNPGLMVDELFCINFKKLFVLVPNYFISEQATHIDGIFTERIHPDHYAWYSPYTIWKLFSSKLSSEYTFELNFFDNKSMISILISKNAK